MVTHQKNPQNDVEKTIKKSNESLNWPRRILRASIIGLCIYFFLTLLLNYFSGKSSESTNPYNIDHLEQNDSTFVAWNGKAPPTKIDLQYKVGYEWASHNKARKHSTCRDRWAGDKAALERDACSNYITKINVTDEIKLMSTPAANKNFNDGTTTAQCVKDREARWSLIISNMRERGDNIDALMSQGENSQIDISQCNNFDNVRIGDVIHDPQVRLTDILRLVRNGSVLTDADRLTIQKDYPGVESFPAKHSQYRGMYLSDADEIFKIAGGKEYVLGKSTRANIPDLATLNKAIVPCQDYVDKVKSFKAEDVKIANEESKVDRNSIQWKDLNESRVSNMNSWGITVGDAKAAGCEI